MAIPRTTVNKAEEGYKFRDWNGELVRTYQLVGSAASFGRGVISTGTEGEVQIPDHGDDLGNGATTGEAAKFVGIVLGGMVVQPDCVLSGEMAAETLGTPIGRDDEKFYKEYEGISIIEKGFVGAIPEEAVAKGDPVYMRISGADDASGKVLGGFRKTDDTATAVEIPGLYWGSAADALEPTHIEMHIK